MALLAKAVTAQQCVVTTPIGGGDDSVREITLQADGRILLGGTSFNGTDRDFALARYHFDLTLDTTLDTDGKVTTDINANDDGTGGLVVQPDGRILLGGHNFIGGPSDDDFVTVRYNANGSLDTSFDTDGIVVTPVDTLWDIATAMVLQSDGKIVQAGYVRVGGAGGDYDLGVVRYNPDGSLDTTFDTDGKVVTRVTTGDDWGNDLLIQPDGKILQAGASDTTDLDFTLVRYNTDGSLDTSFDTDGIVVTPLRAGNDWGSAIALQPDGKIVFAGQSSNGTDIDVAVVRYNSDGGLDTSFDGDGMVFVPVGPGDDTITSVALQTDGKIVVAGTTFNGTDDDVLVVRFNPDGSLDTSFDGDGIVTTPIGAANDSGSAVTLQNDGKILVGGTTDNGLDTDFALIRYDADGSLDPSCIHDVYYSVGTFATDLKNGTPTVDIVNGTATFGTAQPDYIGVGDEVTYNGGTKAYISGRLSSTVYRVTTALGLTPVDAPGATVDSIQRAFNTLNDAITNAVDPTHLNTNNLVAGDFRLHLAGYNDGPMDDWVNTFRGVYVTGYTTDVDHYVRIFAPASLTEVGTSQRHTGVAGTGFRLVPNLSAGSFFPILEVNVEHLRLEGVELSGTSISNGGEINGVFVFGIPTAGTDLRFDKLLIHDLTNTAAGGHVKGIAVQVGNSKVSNSIIYGLTNVSTVALDMAMGIEMNGSGATHFVHNNTIFDVKQAAGSGGGEANGLVDWQGTTTARNNFVGDVVSTSGNENCYRLISTESNNVSSDGTAGGAGSVTGQTAYGSYFVNVSAGNEDLHLLNDSSILWGTVGADLDTDPNLPVVDDIDGGARDGATPDIGADEQGALSLSLALADHALGQIGDRFGTVSPVTDVLFRFQLTRTGLLDVDAVRIPFTTGGGVVDADVTGAALYVDANADGQLDGGDTPIETGVTPSGGVLTFTANFQPGTSATQYLVEATVANLAPGDTTTFSLDLAGIDTVQFGVAESGFATGAVHTRDAARSVYYSVGTFPGDLKSGSPTLTISAGTATFSTPQPDNVGVGDEITYNGATKAYISGRLSSTVYTVTTATGTIPPDDGGATVDSITRAFPSLTAAEAGSSDSAHLNSSDLVAADVRLHWACYNDAPLDEAGIQIDGWTTGPTQFIRIFAPEGPDEVGISQRHNGVAGTGFRLAPINASPPSSYRIIEIYEDYVRIEGLEIDGSGISNAQSANALRVRSTVPATSDIRFDSLLIHDIVNSSVNQATQDGDVFIVMFKGGSSKISNSMLYRFEQFNNNSMSSIAALRYEGTGSHFVHNVTVYDVKNTVSTTETHGVRNFSAPSVTVRNVASLDVVSSSGPEACFAGTLTQSNNVSSDATAAGTGSQVNQTNYAGYFLSVTPGSENLHLLNDSSALWGAVGADLASDPDLPVTVDIDGDARDPTPDVGADEVAGASGVRDVFYSVGTSGADLKTGAPTIDISSGTATLSVAQTGNVGVGDVIDYGAGSKAYIHAVTSPTVYEVRTVTGFVPPDSAGATVNSIGRVFNTWQDAVSQTGTASYLSTFDLVAGSFRVTWVGYNDGPFNVSATTTVSGYTADATHYLTLTVAGASQVASGVSQRHAGIAGTGVRIVLQAGLDAINLGVPHTHLEWLEIDGNDQLGGIGVNIGGGGDFSLLQYLVIHRVSSSTPTTFGDGIGINVSTAATFGTIRNCIIHDYDEDGILIGGSDFTVANTTIFRTRKTGNPGEGLQLGTNAGPVTAENVLSMDNGADFWLNSGATLTCNNCMSSDATADDFGGTGNVINQISSIQFIDTTAGTVDLHLRPGASAMDAGKDLSVSFLGDIDEERRPFGAQWDVGADEAVPARDVYYSVGTSAADLKTGSPTIDIVNGAATLSVAQTGNIGLGDEIDYGAGLHAYIHGVTSQTVFEVRTATGTLPADTGGAVVVNSIGRTFGTLAGAESASTGGSYLGTADLVTAGVRLTWVAYDDADFTQGFTIDGYTTDVARYITLTVAGAADVASGASQRHAGIAGTGVAIDSGGTSNGVVRIFDDYTRFEWFEIAGVKGVLPDQHVVDIGAQGILISHAIVHDFDDPVNTSNDGISIINGGGTWDVTIRNTILYDGQSNCIQGDGADDTVTVENSTIYGCIQGISEDGGSTINLTNVVSMGNGTDYNVTAGNWFNNISQDGTQPGAGSFQVADETTMFVNVTVGDEANWNLHLIAGAPAIDAGVNLWPTITNDIDDQVRGAAFDIGADELAATSVFRSVGATATDLNTGNATVEIVGSTATFSAPMPDNIGVGDVLVYDSGGPRLAYIHGRTSSTVYAVMDGGLPTAAPAGTAVEVYRAYTSLANWHSGIENPNITEPTEDDVNPNPDLTVGNAVMHVACYGDTPAADGPVTINAWTTAPDNYIRIFTPVSAAEVGVSQRHAGVWDDNKYHIENGMTVVSITTNYVRIDGLQVHSTSTVTFDYAGIEITGSVGASYYEVSNSIIRGEPALEDVRIGLNLFMAGSGVLKAWNNIIYDWVGSTTLNSGIVPDDPEFTFYLHNNTLYNNDIGIENASGTVIAKNNLAYNNFSFHYTGAFDASSTNNLSGPNPDAGMPPANARNGVTVVFVDELADDFRLAATDVGARDFGANLSSDPNLAFSDDIEGQARPIGGAWDIGADEGGPSIVREVFFSVGTSTADLKTGSPNISVTGGTATLSVAQTGNIGVGDVITFGGTDVYIHTVTSQTELQVRTVTGGIPADAGSTAVTSIRRTFNSWTDAESQTPTASYLNTADLVAGNFKVTWVGYNDGPFLEKFNINGYTTDAAHFVTVTVAGASQVASGVSQRHNGTAGTGVVVRTQVAGAVLVRDDHTVVEWLEIDGSQGSLGSNGLDANTEGVNGLFTHLIVHDFNGFPAKCVFLGTSGNEIRNSIVYNCEEGLQFNDGDNNGARNVTIFNTTNGVVAANNSIGNAVENVVSVGASGADFREQTGGFFGTFDNNLSQDGTAAGFGGSGNLTGGDPANLFVSVSPTVDLHLKTGALAIDSGKNLSTLFTGDIDAGLRTAPWDIGADDLAATTAVELIAFTATPSDGAVDLFWETGSEIENLGFLVYRAADDGPYVQITPRVIPGLGSSPVGARYSYRDAGLENGETYFYVLEDIETTGRKRRHGPVSATPSEDAAGGPEDGSSEGPVESTARITYGRPKANVFRVLERDRTHVTLELVTQGFYAVPQGDGSVLLEIPDYQPVSVRGSASIPVKRPWIEAVAGVGVAIDSVREDGVESIEHLPVAGAHELRILATRDGNVRAQRRSRRATRRSPGAFPAERARVVDVGFQGDVKKAQLELAPLRWEAATGRLILTRRLLVRVSFEGRVREERTIDGARGRRYRGGARKRLEQTVLARLATTGKGLYAVRYDEVFSTDGGVRSERLRLSRHGEPVAFHIEPKDGLFGPGSTLYFLSGGSAVNPYGLEAVYELELSHEGGLEMTVESGSPGGASTTHYWNHKGFEQNRLYQPALPETSERWLWETLVAPVTKAFVFEVENLVFGVQSPRLTVWLQGTSDFAPDPDHHVRLYVNGSFVAEAFWDGKRGVAIEGELSPGLLVEGENTLELQALDDTDAGYTMWMLDRFAVEYPSALVTDTGRLEGTFDESGTAGVVGVGASPVVLNTSDVVPKWLDGVAVGADGSARFQAEAGRRYLVTAFEASRSPVVRWPRQTGLRETERGADYLVIGPAAFLDDAMPLLDHRENEGLRVAAVSVEDVYEEFGFGEARPEALRDFLTHAYHSWQAPSLRYVLLLGDGTYDFKDYLGTGFQNRVPPLMVRTPFMWTVSDPTLGAVNGEDRLPDLALGRLPARTEEGVRRIVAKILAYEAGGGGLSEALVLVTDDPDGAGDFTSNAEEIARTVLGGRTVRRLHLEELGASAMRGEVLRAFDEGASLVSYMGHGGIHLWADENIFNIWAARGLSPQARQPLFVTMNCLNGYFHFPYFNSLAEELVKAEDKGAIAAFSPSGLSFDAPAHRYHRALLDAVFNQGHRRLGDAVLEAQGTYAASGAYPELLSIYHLLGDPALRLR